MAVPGIEVHWHATLVVSVDSVVQQYYFCPLAACLALRVSESVVVRIPHAVCARYHWQIVRMSTNQLMKMI